METLLARHHNHLGRDGHRRSRIRMAPPAHERERSELAWPRWPAPRKRTAQAMADGSRSRENGNGTPNAPGIRGIRD